MAKKKVKKTDAKARVLASSVNKMFGKDRTSKGGSLARWPGGTTTGNYESDIRGLEVNWEGEYTYTDKVSKQEHKLPAVQARFLYTTVEDDGTELEWDGKMWTIVLEPDKLPEDPKRGKHQTGQRMQRERFKGSLDGLLGYSPDTLLGGLDEAEKLIAKTEEENSVLSVNVYCDISKRKRGENEYTEQYEVIQEVLGGPSEDEEEEEDEEPETEDADEIEEEEEEDEDEGDEEEEEEEDDEEEEEEPAPRKKVTKKRRRK